jgi:anti-sigma-K factor RskA
VNCQRFEQWLDEYLDETLSSDDRMDADRHLATCVGCREVLRRRRGAGDALSRMFQQATASLQLRPEVERLVLRQAAAGPARNGWRWFSRWFVWPVWRWAVLGVVLVATGLLTHHLGRLREVRVEAALAREGETPATIHLSYSVPAHSFERDGVFVWDTLTVENVVVSGTL